MTRHIHTSLYIRSTFAQDFSDEKLKLSQLANKCGDGDLDYYVREVGELLGVTEQIRTRQGSAADAAVPAARVLQHVFEKLLNYKKLEQEDLDGRDDQELHRHLGLDRAPDGAGGAGGGKRVSFDQ